MTLTLHSKNFLTLVVHFLTNALFQRVDQTDAVMHEVSLDSLTSEILSRNFKETMKKFVSHDKGGGFCILIKCIFY